MEKTNAAQAAAMAAAARSTRLTGRAALLAVVICAIALSLAYPVREYLAQRQQIDQLLAQRQATAEQVQALRQEEARLGQASYIEQRAQDALHMCFPAEQCYEVIAGSPAAAARPGKPAQPLVREAVAVGAASRPVMGEVPPRGDDPPGVSPGDVAAIAAQLGREPRGLRAVAHRCPCGLPDVVETAPRLPDGTPFPTLYYLTCPRATAAASGLEASGMMREMTARLADDDTRAGYEQADADYRARRDAAAGAAGLKPLPAGTQSAGGMPERVKCLHALVAHELAVPGANPFGREALAAMGDWWSRGPCVTLEAGTVTGTREADGA